MTREEYINHYKEHYKSRGKTGAGTLEYLEKAKLWRDVGYESDMTVLDYGCGVGSMAYVIPVDKYLGVDIVPQALELAKEDHPDHTFKELEIGKLHTNPKDFVVAMSVFTHALKSDVPDCLADLKRNMKNSGFGLIDILQGEDTGDIHIRYWNLNEFFKELNKAGFIGEVARYISWNNGFTHTYIKICKE